MTPWKHAESSAIKWGGTPGDYIGLHDWFDETKQFTGDWTHRALRHHAAGVQWAIEKFGHTIELANGKSIPTKLVAEEHIIEDCGKIPTAAEWLSALRDRPEEWMLKVKKKSSSRMSFA